MSSTRKASEIIYEDFVKWATEVCPDYDTLPKESLDLLIKAFTGGCIMATNNHIKRARIKEAIAMISPDFSKVPQ